MADAVVLESSGDPLGSETEEVGTFAPFTGDRSLVRRPHLFHWVRAEVLRFLGYGFREEV